MPWVETKAAALCTSCKNPNFYLLLKNWKLYHCLLPCIWALPYLLAPRQTPVDVQPLGQNKGTDPDVQFSALGTRPAILLMDSEIPPPSIWGALKGPLPGHHPKTIESESPVLGLV